MIDRDAVHEMKDLKIKELEKELKAARKCIADLRCLVDRDMIGLAEKYITEFDKARRG